MLYRDPFRNNLSHSCDLACKISTRGARHGQRADQMRLDIRDLFYLRQFGIREDGNFRPLVAHNTTHIDMPLHFLEHTPDLATVLNNPTYRINMPMLARLLDLSTWPDAQCFYEQNGVRYCERVSLEMLPAWEELQQYDALVLLTGFGAVMRQGSEPFHTDAAGFYHLPYITVEVAQRVAAAGISLLAIDCTTVECQTQGNPLRMTGDVHPVLLGNEPPVFILEGVAGDRLAIQAGFVPTEGLLEVIPRRTNAEIGRAHV